MRSASTPPELPELPELGDLLATVHVVRVPLRVRFRGVTEREAVLLRGPAGWGEFAPFDEYDDAEAARWLAAGIESAWSGHPEPVRARVPVNATVPALAPDEVAGVLARFDGCGTAKVKVAEHGQSLSEDIDRVAAVRDAGPGLQIRLDANGGWSVAEALTAIRALRGYGLEYVEQPCARVEELAELRVALARAGLDVPIAADESIRRARDPERVARLHAADVIVVKAAPLGGVRSALAVVARVGLPAVVSSALDTSVGMAAGVALAAALPQLPYACGLGTIELLADDVATVPLRPVGGVLTPRAPGVDPEALARLAAPPARVAWWRDRLARAHAVLVGRRPGGHGE